MVVWCSGRDRHTKAKTRNARERQVVGYEQKKQEQSRLLLQSLLLLCGGTAVLVAIALHKQGANVRVSGRRVLP